MNNWNWIIDSNYIFGYDKDILKKSSINIDIVYMFDLDYTLIKTKSGKVFPKYIDDWELLNDNVKTKLTKLFEKKFSKFGGESGGLEIKWRQPAQMVSTRALWTLVI